MHCFKIVCKRKLDGGLIIAVPHQWESRNILHWPGHLSYSDLELLRSNAASTPEENWEEYKCTLKGLNISSFKEALQTERMLNIIAVENSGISDEGERQMSESLKILKKDLSDVKRDVCEIKEEITEIRREYSEINANLDKLFSLILNQVNEPTLIRKDPKGCSQQEDYLKNFEFPLRTCEEVTKLEKEIQTNPEFRKQLISQLSKISGTSGELNGSKVAYKVIDWVFASDVLTYYSWTGVSRGDRQKRPFNALEGVISIFFEVLYLADNRHTQKKNEDIFKEGALKHSKKRNLRKRPKSYGIRLKNIQSYKFKPILEQQDQSQSHGTDDGIEINEIGSSNLDIKAEIST